MKLTSFPRFNAGDYQDSPDWFRRFLETLNPLMDEIVTGLQGKLTVEDNLGGVYKQLEVLDDTEVEIKTDLTFKPNEVVLVWTSHESYAKLTWQPIGNESIRFKVKWDSAPSGKATVMLRIQGE